MTKAEYIRLYSYHATKRGSAWSPRGGLYQGKRSVKNKAKAVGQVLKSSSLTCQVHPETHFKPKF